MAPKTCFPFGRPLLRHALSVAKDAEKAAKHATRNPGEAVTAISIRHDVKDLRLYVREAAKLRCYRDDGGRGFDTARKLYLENLEAVGQQRRKVSTKVGAYRTHTVLRRHNRLVARKGKK